MNKYTFEHIKDTNRAGLISYLFTVINAENVLDSITTLNHLNTLLNDYGTFYVFDGFDSCVRGDETQFEDYVNDTDYEDLTPAYKITIEYGEPEDSIKIERSVYEEEKLYKKVEYTIYKRQKCKVTIAIPQDDWESDHEEDAIEKIDDYYDWEDVEYESYDVENCTIEEGLTKEEVEYCDIVED